MSTPVRMPAALPHLSTALGAAGDGPHPAPPPQQRPSIALLRRAIAERHDSQLLQLLGQMDAAALNRGDGPSATPLLVEVATQTSNPRRLTWLLRELLAQGAAPGAVDSDNVDALTAVMRRSDQPVAAALLLLRWGAQVVQRPQGHMGPLHLLLLSWRGEAQTTVLRAMLAGQVDLYSPSARGPTPLGLATCAPEGPRVVATLLAACPPHLRSQMAQATWWDAGPQRPSDAGMVALLHQHDDVAAEQILAQLVEHGLDLAQAESRARARLGESSVGRDAQGIRGCCMGAVRQLRAGAARPQTPQAVVPQIMITPATEPAGAEQQQLLPSPPPLAARTSSPASQFQAAGVPSAAAPIAATAAIARPPLPAPPIAAARPPSPARPMPQSNCAHTPAPPLPWPREPSSEEVFPARRALFVANPGTSPPTAVALPAPAASVAPRVDVAGAAAPAQVVAAAPRAFARATAAPVIRRHVFGAPQAKFETMGLHEVARSGPLEAFDTVLAHNPQALITRDRLKRGGHMPLTLAVMSRDSRLVVRVLEALGEGGHLTPDILDAPGTDGRCALAVAIENNGQQQTKALLQAGASPLLPIPQPARGLAQAFKLATKKPAAHAAEFAIRQGRPYVLTLLLQWDERDAAKKQSRRFTFDVADLIKIGQTCGPKMFSPELRAALEDAAQRRRPAPAHAHARPTPGSSHANDLPPT